VSPDVLKQALQNRRALKSKFRRQTGR
jgi:hypothetical protein